MKLIINEQCVQVNAVYWQKAGSSTLLKLRRCHSEFLQALAVFTLKPGVFPCSFDFSFLFLSFWLCVVAVTPDRALAQLQEWLTRTGSVRHLRRQQTWHSENLLPPRRATVCSTHNRPRRSDRNARKHAHKHGWLQKPPAQNGSTYTHTSATSHTTLLLVIPEQNDYYKHPVSKPSGDAFF